MRHRPDLCVFVLAERPSKARLKAMLMSNKLDKMYSWYGCLRVGEKSSEGGESESYERREEMGGWEDRGGRERDERRDEERTEEQRSGKE